VVGWRWAPRTGRGWPVVIGNAMGEWRRLVVRVTEL
jgi:hypothetical protein